MQKAHIITNISDIKEKIGEIKCSGLTLGFVPTMGALHIGHESLIERANTECDAVIVSIFVNPIQFGPNEDFSKYPRQLEQDREICSKYGVDYIFAPIEQEMYPGKYVTEVVPPALYQDRLCGKSRPGHFNGVATVVLKLFNIITPDKAYFGEKDAQQLAIIKKMVQDLNVPVEIIGCPIIRDADGLACSSRNKYLTKESREKALTLYKVLQAHNLDLLHPDIELEYFEEVELGQDKFFAIAAKVDGVRLIDNIRL
ncbi:MAG: hypothetical protein A2Y25_05475 [Candidatus Melainabacteria bacterium GWF2_37_15]|nr:MAG: hypothetical protein A2Y25_05475 [Candidatus Melainabacteria bacterium GWF2_37_15]